MVDTLCFFRTCQECGSAEVVTHASTICPGCYKPYPPEPPKLPWRDHEAESGCYVTPRPGNVYGGGTSDGR